MASVSGDGNIRMLCDVRCPECGGTHGWGGLPGDVPPCPECGHEVDPAAAASDAAEVRHALRALGAIRAAKASGDRPALLAALALAEVAADTEPTGMEA